MNNKLNLPKNIYFMIFLTTVAPGLHFRHTASWHQSKRRKT